jgi:hypothetical protein
MDVVALMQGGRAEVPAIVLSASVVVRMDGRKRAIF